MSSGEHFSFNIRGESEDIYNFCKRHCSEGFLDYNTFIPQPEDIDDYDEKYKRRMVYEEENAGTFLNTPPEIIDSIMEDFPAKEGNEISLTKRPVNADEIRSLWRFEHWGVHRHPTCMYTKNLPEPDQDIGEFFENEIEIGLYHRYGTSPQILKKMFEMYPELTITVIVKPEYDFPPHIRAVSKRHNREKYGPDYESPSSRTLDYLDRKYDLIKPGGYVMVQEDEGVDDWQRVVDYKIISKVYRDPFDCILSNVSPKNLDYDDFRFEILMINNFIRESGNLVFRAMEDSGMENLIDTLKIKFERVETFEDNSLDGELYVICLNADEEDLKIVDDSQNFKYLDDLVHSGNLQIILDSDIVLGDGEESKYDLGVELDVDGLVIDGAGHVIDACGRTRIFDCTGKNVTLKNFIFINGTSLEGGAVSNRGSLTISDSIFANNSASLDGGAIFSDYFEAEKLLVRDSVFINNTAESLGRAVYTEVNLRVERSMFFESLYDTSGPIDTLSDKFEILDCRFEIYGDERDWF